MVKRRWTLVIVPPGSGASKIIEVSQSVLKLAAGLSVIAVLVAVVLGYSTYSRSLHLSHASAVEKENQALSTEIATMAGRIDSLSDTLDVIALRDSRIRLLANLDPIDPQVQQAGIGGPERVAPRPASQVVREASRVGVDLNALVRRANLLAASFREAAESLATNKARMEATPSIMPTQGWLSSAFSSMRAHPILHINRPHEGIDVAAPMGAPIEAPANGVVISARWENGYGNIVEISHGYGIVTKFAHASKLLVGVGARVTRGQRVALVGSTGLATGPHLHYEVHVNGKPVDPLRYVLPEAIVD
ncbi:MAG TPA: M23 family metallopeptidase [Gemmatimonadales bacterium]|jgi:murein DD-endopeptidase MepM/ murein hydrolase activator NlpD|nr:M23 family metallopeptidase [Gemmatimonadales bacterium]